jgi:NADH-quinone oxidoreductase subunit G
MAKITIDGNEYEVADGMTIIQACEQAGIEIPKFCYHERLEIAGNCRMCLVELEKVPKPVASCAQPVTDGMVVRTNSPKVKKAREGVMEFLLINHPLDCPICDQGGECDLQDQAMAYGKGGSRFAENKRTVRDKYMGPLIKTSMTRCIHCTRCVRFAEDIAGVAEIGAIGRGEEMEITTYVEQAVKSELSGNVIDLCPVGALTSKPYAFKARVWELKKTESIDVLDAVGSNIRVDSRGREVMRILPRLHEGINEEWISDKTRFFYDGLKYQRLDTPMVKRNGKLNATSWEAVLQEVVQKLKAAHPNKIGAIAGDLTDVESMLLMKELLQSLGSPNYDCRQDGSLIGAGASSRADYLFNTTIVGIEKADACLIVGSNPRHEATIVNARLRKAYLANNMKVGVVGAKVELTYPYKHLGATPWILKQISEGSHPFCATLEKANNPILIVGSGALKSENYEAMVYHLKKIAHKYNIVREDWNGFNFLPKAAACVGGLDIGFVPGEGGLTTQQMLKDKMEVLFLMGADEAEIEKLSLSTYVIYIGHHGDKAAYRADVILPAAAFTEKEATYVNLEGRVQHTQLAVYAPGEAKPDWEIINELYGQLHETGAEKYESLAEVRQKMAQVNEIFSTYDEVSRASMNLELGRMKDFSTDSFPEAISNYYMSDPITRHSKIMAQCSQEILGK